MGTVTIGSVTYDIYGDHVGVTTPLSADEYLGGSLNASAWTAATVDDQARALVTAGRIFDKQLWVGTMTDTVTPQPLAWPRTGVPTCDGIVADPNVIPDRVIFGSYEYALAILQDATTQTEVNTGSNVKRQLERKKVGDLETEDETEYFSATNSGVNVATRFPTTVQEYIRCYIGGTLDGATVAGGAASVFIDWDYGVNSPGTL